MQKETFDNIQHLFMIKRSINQKLNLIKIPTKDLQLTLCFMLRTRSFPSEIRPKASMTLPLLLFNIILNVMANAIKQERKIRCTLIGKKEIRVYVFDCSVMFMQKIQNNQQNFLKLISNYSKVAGCKVNIQTPTSYFYNYNKQVEFKVEDR